MAPLPLPPAHYPQYWAEFRARSTDLISSMVALTKTITDQFTGQHIGLLTIGPGTGLYEKTLLKETGLKLAYYHGVEQNPKHVEQLEKMVKTWGVEYYLDNGYFTKDFACSRTFDLILMSNVMYYIPDTDRIDIINKAISLLSPRGKVVILLQGEAFAGIKVLEEMTGFTSGGGDYSLTGKSFAKVLENAGIKCEEISLPARLDIHDFVMGNNMREKWSYPISFLLQTDFDVLDKDVQDKVMDLVKDRAVVNDGVYGYPRPQSMIVLEQEKEA